MDVIRGDTLRFVVRNVTGPDGAYPLLDHKIYVTIRERGATDPLIQFTHDFDTDTATHEEGSEDNTIELSEDGLVASVKVVFADMELLEVGTVYEADVQVKSPDNDISTLAKFQINVTDDVTKITT